MIIFLWTLCGLFCFGVFTSDLNKQSLSWEFSGALLVSVFLWPFALGWFFGKVNK